MAIECFAGIDIWGKITKEQLETLEGLLDDSMDFLFGGGSASEEIELALSEERAISTNNSNACEGRFEELEEWLTKNGLSFRRYSTDNSEDCFNGCVWKAPDQGLDGYYDGDEQSISVDMLRMLEAAMAEVEKLSLEDAPKYLISSNHLLRDWAEEVMTTGALITSRGMFEKFLREHSMQEPEIRALVLITEQGE